MWCVRQSVVRSQIVVATLLSFVLSALLHIHNCLGCWEAGGRFEEEDLKDLVGVELDGGSGGRNVPRRDLGDSGQPEEDVM